MKIELYHTTDELKQLFRKEKDTRIATRIRAAYLGLMAKAGNNAWQKVCLKPEKKQVNLSSKIRRKRSYLMGLV